MRNSAEPIQGARTRLAPSRRCRVDLDTWLHHYNTERPHFGYRNQGRGPSDTINLSVSQGELEDKQ